MLTRRMVVLDLRAWLVSFKATYEEAVRVLRPKLNRGRVRFVNLVLQ
jgi:hypothetical protein